MNAEQGNQLRRPWTPVDEEYLFEHRGDSHDELARALRRTLPSIRSQLTKRGWAPHRAIENSYAPTTYRGPQGWTINSGLPPCPQCRFHRRKLAHCGQLRHECLKCEARVEWDFFNRGGPVQSSEALEIWPAELS